MINKRGQGMPVNVIIIAILALLVLVILAVMVAVRFGIFGERTQQIESQICASTGGACRTQGGCQSAVEAREGVGAFNPDADWTSANPEGKPWTDCIIPTRCCVI